MNAHSQILTLIKNALTDVVGIQNVYTSEVVCLSPEDVAKRFAVKVGDQTDRVFGAYVVRRRVSLDYETTMSGMFLVKSRTHVYEITVIEARRESTSSVTTLQDVYDAIYQAFDVETSEFDVEATFGGINCNVKQPSLTDVRMVMYGGVLCDAMAIALEVDEACPN